MRLISYEGRKKIYYLLILVAISLAAYLAIKYVLPIFLPFLVAYLISLILHRAVLFLNRKLKINGKFATFLVIASVIIVSVVGLVLIGMEVIEQAKVLAGNVDKIVIVVEDCVYSICDVIGRTFGINSNKVYNIIEVNMSKLSDSVSGEFLNKIYANTTGIAKGTINFIILLVFVFTAIIYMVKNMNSIQKAIDNCYFSKEIKEAKKLFRQVIVAYVKAQLIIIVVTSIICTVGLYILDNPYSLSIGIIIGLIDALPLLGTSVVLLPWTVVSVLQGEYFYAAMLFTMFILAYMAREIIEPKVMGRDVGISPILSLVAIYVGYTLFGFFGMFIGPFVFVVIMRIMKVVRNKLDNIK